MLEIKMENGIPSYWKDDEEITEEEYAEIKRSEEKTVRTVRRFAVSLSGVIKEVD